MRYFERPETILREQGVTGPPKRTLHVRRVPLKELAENLAALERRYRMPSALFYERYRRGELGDDLDFVEWAGLYELAVRLGLISPP